MYTKLGKNFDFALPAVDQYDEVHQDLFWYLLEQTRVTRCASVNSLREFLIRYFLISKRPIDQTAEEFINEGLLFSGTIGDRYFSFGIRDLFHFIGFGKSDDSYHLQSYLEDFIANYKSKKYMIKIQPDEEGGATKISKDTLIIAFSGVTTLLQIDSLNLEFREDLSEVQPEEIAQVTTFVDYVMQQIPSQVFEDYQSKLGNALRNFSEYYIAKEKVSFDPWTQLPKATLVQLFEHLLDDGDKLLAEYRDNEEVDEDVIHDLNFHIPFIKFAYGVKHGYVVLNDNWMSPYNNYSIEYNLDPLEEMAGENGEAYATDYIYKCYCMDEWIHLIP
jgi:hypothetical protein